MVYNRPEMYLEMSKRQNDFHTPNRRDTHASVWQTLVKLRELWETFGRPKARDEDIIARGKMLLCMAAVLNLKLDEEKNLTLKKVSTKMYDWISHACREDDEAFEDVVKIGKEVDHRNLHLDSTKESAWKTYVEKRRENAKVKEPKKIPMTINWLRPLRGLNDEDYKELVHKAVYDHEGKRQRLYFSDVDKPFPKPKTLEYVSMRLRQRYAVRNALRWLEIEGSISSYKTMEAFMGIDVARFGDHDTLVALGMLGTKSFISHWASPLYVHVSTLKKYGEEIPLAVRAHHKDIVSGGQGFKGKVRHIGDHAYSLPGWLWEAHLKKRAYGSTELQDVHIMHRGGLFTGGSGQLGEPTLWVVDCRWGGSERPDKPWTSQDYENSFEILQDWMNGGPRWNVVFLCPDGEDRRSLVKKLRSPGRIVHHGTWGFTPETATQKESLSFEKQEIMSMEVLGDIVIVIVCPGDSNPIENLPRIGKNLPRLFQDHTSKYEANKECVKRRTPEEITRLIKSYLPKTWALALVGLGSSVPAILEHGFVGSRILSLDSSSERNMELSQWIREQEGVQFQCPLEEPEEDDYRGPQSSPNVEDLIQTLVSDHGEDSTIGDGELRLPPVVNAELYSSDPKNMEAFRNVELQLSMDGSVDVHHDGRPTTRDEGRATGDQGPTVGAQGRLKQKRKDPVLVDAEVAQDMNADGRGKQQEKRTSRTPAKYTSSAPQRGIALSRTRTCRVGASGRRRGSKGRTVIEETMVQVEYEPIISSQIAKKKRTRITKEATEVSAELVSVSEPIPLKKLYTLTNLTNTVCDAWSCELLKLKKI